MARALFFWDYDTQWGADRSRTGGGAKTWGPLEFPHTDRLLELHAQYEIPACFAVVGAAALPGEHPYHDPGQIRRIHAAGHEVASHSFQHEWLPALNPAQLRQSLSRSKVALEDCLGAEVLSFVPPFDMPIDYPARLSFNWTERREVPGPGRTDIPRLCEALLEVGYRFCRVNYRPLWEVLGGRWWGGRLPRPISQPEQIAGLTCLRVNTPPGFESATRQTLERLAGQEGYILFYGHPHHLGRAESAESEGHLRPLLERLAALRAAGRITFCTPRQVLP